MNILRRVVLSLLWAFIPSAIQVSLRNFFDLWLGAIPTVLLYAPFIALLRATWTGKFDKKVSSIPTSSQPGSEPPLTIASPCSGTSNSDSTESSISSGAATQHHKHEFPPIFHRYESFIVCPSWGSLVPRKSKQCDCGYEFQSPVSKVLLQFWSHSRNYLPYLMAILLFVIGIASGYYIAQSRMQSELSAIETQLSDLKKEHASLKHENKQLLRENNSLKSDLNSFNRSVGFIVEGSDYYHTYECDIFQSSDDYLAHNTELCEFLGYSACPLCH